MNNIKRFTAHINTLSANNINSDLLKLDDEAFITNTISSSDKYMDRIRIIFKNNHELSIIRGEGSFGNKEGLFEIIAITDIPNYNDPIGYCNINSLNTHIKRISALPKYTKTKEL